MSLRIAYLIDSLGGGGSERSLAEMLPYLVRAGVEPRVFVLTEPEAGFSNLVRTDGIAVEALPVGSRLRKLLALRRHLAEWRPQLLHTALFYSDVLGRIAAIGTGIPVLSSLVNSGYSPERRSDPRVRRWRFETVRRIDGWTSRHLTDHLHSVSQATKESAVRWLGLPPEKITVIRRGRDLERLGEPGPERRRRARAKWNIADEEALVVNVGRHAYQKAQIVLLEAVARLVEHGYPIRLVVAGGEGSCTDALREFIDAHDLGGRVLLAGFVEDVPELLAAGDVFAFPSRLEGLPGAVLEAMAMALPIVASDIGPLQEIFPEDEGALLVEQGSATALAGALQRLLDDRTLRQALGAASRDNFLARFDIRRTIPETMALYREVAGCA
jgi:glycosyltransferase involved in cell wall biosynthesis